MQLSKRTKLTFFGLLENTFGRVAARIVYGVFALFFALSAVLPMLEQKGIRDAGAVRKRARRCFPSRPFSRLGLSPA